MFLSFFCEGDAGGILHYLYFASSFSTSYSKDNQADTLPRQWLSVVGSGDDGLHLGKGDLSKAPELGALGVGLECVVLPCTWG